MTTKRLLKGYINGPFQFLTGIFNILTGYPSCYLEITHYHLSAVTGYLPLNFDHC